MATVHYGVNDDKVNGNGLNGYEWDILARILDSQTEASLRILGRGVIRLSLISGDDNLNSYKVTASDAQSVSVAPGMAITLHLSYGHIYLFNSTTVSISGLVEGTTYYIYVRARLATAPTEADSREGSQAVVFASDDANEANSVLLATATVADGVVTVDETVREYSRIERILDLIEAQDALITALQDKIGYPYDEVALGTIKSRLAALSGDSPGDGPVVITKLSQLKYNDDDSRNAITVLDENMDALEARMLAAIKNNGQRPAQTNIDQLWHELSIVRQMAGKDQPDELLRSRSTNLIATEDGRIFGDGTNGFPDFIESTNLTLNADGTLEP